MIRSFTHMYSPLIARWNGRWFSPQSAWSWETRLATKDTGFYMTVPAEWQAVAERQIQTVWPYATVKVAEDPVQRLHPNMAGILGLREHYLFRLKTDRRTYGTIEGILDCLRLMEPDDAVHIQTLMVPASPDWWDSAAAAYEEYREGRMPKRVRLDPAGLLQYGVKSLAGIVFEVTNCMQELFEAEPTNFQEGTDRAKVLRDGPMGTMSPAKIREDAFDVSVRIAVQAKGSTKAKTLLRSVAFAFRDLDGDNSLVLQETSPDRLFCDMQARKPGMKVNHDYLGVSEVVKLVALPPAALQEKHHLSSVAYRETDLPKAVTSGGIRIGEATYKGQAVPVYIPTDVLDETCLPRVAIGGMGTGKTTFGANVATRSVQAGFCSVVIDPAKGEIGDAIEKVLPKEQVVRIRFGSKPYRLDWRESQHGERSLNRLTNEMVAFFEAAAEEAGAQTVRYLRAAAKAAPGESLGGIVRLLTEPMDELTLASIRPSERPLWSSYAELSDARRAQIAAPVLNRLDTILGDDYLSECMEAAEGIDLVELVDSGPKAIVFDVPKGELGAEAVDVLASLIATKIDLAMVLRKTRYPVFVIQDEPHQYIRSSRTWKSAVVESRKWRFAYVWLFHAWEQINHDLAAIIKAACPHYHLFTTSKLTYRALAEEIAPFTVEEAMQTPRHWCLHVIRAAGQTVPPFLAKMDGPIRRQQL